MTNEAELTEHFNKVLLFLSHQLNKDKQFGYEDLVEQLNIPKEYRSAILDKLWYSNPKLINAEPAIKNPKISINNHGLQLAEKLEQDYFEATGKLFYYSPKEIHYTLKEACDYIFKEHLKSTNHTILWVKDVARQMPINYLAALESLKADEIIFERTGRHKTTYLNVHVEDALDYETALNIMHDRKRPHQPIQYTDNRQTTHGPNSPIAGNDVTQTTTNNPPPTKKKWYDKWIDEFVKNAVQFGFTAIATLLVGIGIGKSCNQADNPKSSLPANRETLQDTSQNKTIIKTNPDSIKR